MYSIFFTDENSDEQNEVLYTEQDLIDNNYNIDISNHGNIGDFRLSDSIVSSKKSIKVSINLRIWFYFFNDYKNLIEKANNKVLDLDYVQTGSKVIIKKENKVGYYINHNQVEILFGKCLEFNYNPDKGNCFLSFETGENGSLYSLM